jgi:putative endonuclease
MARAPCVYIMANKRNGTLCTGVTSNLPQRVFQHREGPTLGFTSRYGRQLLVFYERHERMDDAIAREKQLKGGSRARKVALIQAMNPTRGGGDAAERSQRKSFSCRAGLQHS